MIGKMPEKKLADGQLDQSNLTLKEIDLTAGKFVYNMPGINHSRIEYL